MISYILKEPKCVEAQEGPKPVPQGREVLVRIRYVGICGSDIHLFNGTYNGPHSYPMRFGHEWSGVVEAVGSEVTRVEVGDVVTAAPVRPARWTKTCASILKSSASRLTGLRPTIFCVMKCTYTERRRGWISSISAFPSRLRSRRT